MNVAEIPGQVIVPAALVAAAYLFVVVVILLILIASAIATWWRGRRDEEANCDTPDERPGGDAGLQDACELLWSMPEYGAPKQEGESA